MVRSLLLVSIGPLGPLHVISDGRSLITVQVRVTLVPAVGVSGNAIIVTECFNSEKKMKILQINIMNMLTILSKAQLPWNGFINPVHTCGTFTITMYNKSYTSSSDENMLLKLMSTVC